MTLLPSLFESRPRFSSLFRRGRYSDLEDMMENLLAEVPTWEGNGKRFPLDIEELDDKYVIQSEIPGVEKKDIEVTLQDRMLTIQIKQEREKEEERKNYICKERYLGTASRSVMLPHAASEKDVDATLKEGVLRLTIKKEPAETTKRVAIH